jgi:hypothetical protein
MDDPAHPLAVVGINLVRHLARDDQQTLLCHGDMALQLLTNELDLDQSSLRLRNLQVVEPSLTLGELGLLGRQVQGIGINRGRSHGIDHWS